VILFCSTADTDILTVEHARGLLPPDFPEVRCANPAHVGDPRAFVDVVVSDARVVIVRLLGGRQGWAAGLSLLADRCGGDSIPLFAFGGELEPDAELARDSTVSGGAWAQAFEYLRHGGVTNVANLLRFVSDTVLVTGFGFDPPAEVPACGVYRPELVDNHDPARPTVGIVFYRAHLMSGNTAFVDALLEAMEAAGANALPVFCYSLRPDADGTVAALQLLKGRVDALECGRCTTGGGGRAARRMARLGDSRPRRSGCPRGPGDLRDHEPKTVGGKRVRSYAPGRGDAGRDPGVRRTGDRCPVLLQGTRGAGVAGARLPG
jgi:cobaltochelatase CobN